MKTTFFSLILISIFISGNIFAQQNLDLVRKELDKKSNEIESKNIKTDFFESSYYLIGNDTQHKKYIEKIQDAFEKDRPNAKRVVKKEHNNQITNQMLTFFKDSSMVMYFMNQTPNNFTFRYNHTKNSHNNLVKKLNVDSLLKSYNITADSLKNFFSERKDIFLDSTNWNQYSKSFRIFQDSIFKEGNIVLNGNFFEHFPYPLKKQPKYMIPEDGYITIDGEKMTAKEARKKGYDVGIIPKDKNKELKEKGKFVIPKDGYIIIDGEKLNAKEARKKGYDVETF